MKYLILFLLLLPTIVFSQTKHVIIPGTLSSMFNVHEEPTVSDLIITGTLNDNDFEYLNGLQSLVNLNLNGITNVNIPDLAFFMNKSIETIILPDYLESIGHAAFTSSNLISIDLPVISGSVGNGLFKNCYNLKHVSIKYLNTISSTMFQNCISLNDIILPESIDSLGISSFNNCIVLKVINLPTSISYIGSNTFQDCINLDSVICYSIVPIDISNSTDIFMNTNPIIIIPIDSESIYETYDEWSITNLQPVLDIYTNIISVDTNYITVIDTIINDSVIINDSIIYQTIIDSITQSILDTINITLLDSTTIITHDTIQTLVFDTILTTITDTLYETVNNSNEIVDTMKIYILEQVDEIAGLNIFYRNGYLYINNLTSRDKITLAYQSGYIIYNGFGTPIEMSFKLDFDGVYILRINNDVRKILTSKI